MYLGIDQSITQTGVVILGGDGKVIHSEVASFTRYDHQERLIKIYIYFSDLAKRYPKMKFGVEDYAFNSFYSREKMGELRGIIELALIHNNINYQIVPIKVHRKSTYGNGNIKKDEAANMAMKLYGVRFVTLDEFDAFSIAYFLFLDHKRSQK